jgi:cation:H+ antiporter
MWFDLLVCAAAGGAVAASGTVLAREADRIGEISGLGRLRVGSLLLAAATSLPEMTTEVAAVRIGAADLAAGDALGSSMANMLVLAVVDLLPPRNLLQRATVDNVLVASLAITLNTLAAVFVVSPVGLQIGRVGVGSIVLLTVYLVGMRVVLANSSPASREPVPPEPEIAAEASRRAGRRRVAVRSGASFAVAAVVVLLAGPLFARSAAALAHELGIAQTFVGTLLVGMTTSLPELAASLAAARMGAFDLAVANLFGSNAFNMVLFFVMDLAAPTPIFGAISAVHVTTALFSNLLMAIGVAAIVLRSRSRLTRLEPSSGAMLLTYVVALWFVWGTR